MQENLVVLNADQKAVLKRTIVELVSGLTYLQDLAARDELPAEGGRNILYVAEAAFADIGKLTGIEVDSAAARDARYAALRSANERVSDLERKLGERVGAAAVSAALANLADKVQLWWGTHGFGLVRNLDFTSDGACRIEFSTRLYGAEPPARSATPVSGAERREAWLAGLRARGYELGEGAGSDGPVLVDSAVNRALLDELLRQHLPSAKLTGVGTARCSGLRDATLRSLHVTVHALEDIERLDQPDAGAAACP